MISKLDAELDLDEIIKIDYYNPRFQKLNLLYDQVIRLSENNYLNYDSELKKLKNKLDSAIEENQSKSIYLANMSHEMRTPLNSIIGYTQLIDKIGFDDLVRVNEYINRVNNSSEILLKKINDILDLAKIESGQFELFAKPAEIKVLVKEVYDLLSIHANKKGIEFEYRIDPLIPNCLLMDETRFKQVLINLCSNAIKFTTEGFVKLEIELFGHINDSIVLDFKVSDTGCGIPSDKLEKDKIFTPFVQANNSKTNGNGTGLGLTISRDLIRLMGGDIHVTSKVGVGTIFSFTTIFETCDLPTVEKADGNISDEEISALIQDKDILVVEDNHINQVLVTEVFNVFGGKQLDLANDGYEAVEMTNAKQYDIIFMDIQMPNCDGVKATKMIRRLVSYQNTPIIALTANAFSEQINEYLEIGMNDYLKKPFDIVNLKKILIEHLAK